MKSDLRSIGLRESLRLGCCHGVTAWTAYGIAEFVFSLLLPAILRSGKLYTTFDYLTLAFLFGVYAILAVLFGLSSGALLWRLSRRSEAMGKMDAPSASIAAAQLGVLAMFALNL